MRQLLDDFLAVTIGIKFDAFYVPESNSGIPDLLNIDRCFGKIIADAVHRVR